MLILLFSLFYASFSAAAQTPAYTIETIAGSDPLAEGGLASLAAIEDARSVALDQVGNVYFSDTARHRVLRIGVDGILKVIAGDGANATALNQPYGIAVDHNGDVYIADLGNARVRRVSADGRIQTIAGGGTTRPGPTSVLATQVELKAPRNVAVDAAGNVYIADFLDHRVLRVSTDGQLQVIAGTGVAGATTDSVPATQGTLSYPTGLYVDSTGLYIADSGNHAIRKVASGVMTTLRFQDAAAFINLPTGICADNAGNLYIASSGFSQTVRVSRSGAVAIVVAEAAKDVAVDQAGTLYLAAGPYVRKVTTGGAITTLAGTGGQFRGDGSAATSALLNVPSDVKMDANGVLYIADTKNNRIRKVQGGIMSSVGGELSGPQGIAVDAAGNLYVADTENHRVRRIGTDGQVRTVAGTGTAGSNGDVKLAVEAQLNAPTAVAVDSLGQVHIADSGNHKVRRLLASGYLVTIAGNGRRGFAGDGANSQTSQLDTPRGLAFDSAGNLYIADSGNRRIRKVAMNGVISTIVDDGLTSPVGVAVDTAGALWVSDAGDQRIRWILPQGAPQSIAGCGTRGFGGDGGAALLATLNEPGGITIGGDGVVYFADRQNHRVRKLAKGTVTPPVVERLPEIRVLHAATLEGAPLAPGMLISVEGTGVGPATAQSGQNGLGGALESSLAGTEVRFDGKPAPILYAQQNLIQTQVPYRVLGQPLVLVEVVRDGKVQGSAVLEVAAHSPGIFTSSSGSGQVTAVNEDYTLNSAGTGAARGSLLTFYATGEGITDPASVDGKLNDAPYPTPRGAIEVTIGDQTADVVSIGCGVTSPGMMQITVRVPLQAATGVQAIVLKAGGVPSQHNATIVVK
jgi:uncharacterized protein (TIGR03437 family)